MIRSKSLRFGVNWKNGEATDMSDNGWHGTITGATVVDAPFGQGLRFNGIDQAVSFPNSVIGSGSKTLCFWLKLLSGNVQYSTVFSNARDTAGAYGMLLWFNSPTEMELRFGGSGNANIRFPTPPLNEWGFWEIRFDYSNGYLLEIRRDGVILGQIVPGFLDQQSSWLLYMGALPGYPYPSYCATFEMGLFYVFKNINSAVAYSHERTKRVRMKLNPL